MALAQPVNDLLYSAELILSQRRLLLAEENNKVDSTLLYGCCILGYYRIYTGNKGIGQHGTAPHRLFCHCKRVMPCRAMIDDMLCESVLTWHHFFNSVDHSVPKWAVLALKSCFWDVRRLGLS